MFGNEVTGPQGVKVKSVNWILPSADAGLGELQFTFHDGSTARLRAVRADVAFVARRIVFDPPQGIDRPQLGDRIGLVGLLPPAGPRVWPVSGSTPEEIDIARRNEIVLHPALADTEIGWCVIGIDLLPLIRDYLIREVRENAGEASANGVKALWSGMSTKEHITYRIVDVPVKVGIEGEGANRDLVARRSVMAAEKYPDGLRATAFLEMWPILSESAAERAEQIKELEGRPKKLAQKAQQLEQEAKRLRAAGEEDEAIDTSEEAKKSRKDAVELHAYLKDAKKIADRDNVNRTFASAFYRFLPQLCQASPEYAGANALARVVAVLRWAASTGATFEDSVAVPPTKPTPLAILMSQRFGLRGTARFADPENGQKAFSEEIERLSKALAAREPKINELEAFRTKFMELQDRAAAIWGEYFESAEGESESAEKAVKSRLEAVSSEAESAQKDYDMLLDQVKSNPGVMAWLQLQRSRALNAR
jgi:hypothetical protein